MLVSINMYVNAHCEATKKQASERVCVVKNLDLHTSKMQKCVFTRTRSIYLFQYRGVLACWCLSICMPTPTVRLQKSPKDPFGPQGAPVGESERASVCQESCFVLACSHQGR